MLFKINFIPHLKYTVRATGGISKEKPKIDAVQYSVPPPQHFYAVTENGRERILLLAGGFHKLE